MLRQLVCCGVDGLSSSTTTTKNIGWVKLFFQFALNALMHRIEGREHTHRLVGIAMRGTGFEQCHMTTRLTRCIT